MSIEDKSTEIHFRISLKEKQRIQEIAASLGFKSVSKYIKRVALNRETIKPKADVELMVQIRKVGTNINQIAAICNQYKSDKVIMDIAKSLEDDLALLRDTLGRI